MADHTPIIVKKSYRDGCVGLAVKLTSRGWNGPSIAVTGSADITAAQARGLAHALLAAAGAVDVKALAKAEREARRKAWQEREIAAGRMVVLGKFADE